MHNEDESRVQLPHVSLAERLRRQHGREIDPRVELEAAPAPPESAGQTSARSQLSSKVLTRLEARGAVASRYRMHGEIARGGMGAILEVYDEDLRRKLAMKVMLAEGGGSSASMRTPVDPAKLARFLEEAQVTGQLDHPGIVPVHELGIDAHGQVYFTMRLVRGRDLAAIFRLVPSASEGWTMTRAVGLLLKVSEAMAYAHSKGVVHRDLKPANVMVGQFGEVYVMDWGLARVRNQPERSAASGATAPAPRTEIVHTDRREDSGGPDSANLFTMDGDIMGTPSYMSLEQARGKLDQINEASDVYSLGAMLYRLLGGVAPYCLPGEAARPELVIERLFEGPPKSIEELAPDAPAELVAICEKAMARDASARYPSMSALGDDLRAYLEGRVVAAFETGAWAEARKWVRRNRALAGALAAAVLALVAGLGASVVLGKRAQAAAQLAETQRGSAEISAAQAREQAAIAARINSFLNDDLLAAVAPEFQGVDVTVRDVLDQAALRLDAQFKDEPLIESELRGTIGTSYGKLGFGEAALEQLERALVLDRANARGDSEHALKLELERAHALASLGRFEDSIASYRELIDRARAKLGPEHHLTMNAISDKGIVLRDAGRSDEARATYEEALELEARVLGPDHTDTLTTLSNLALLDQAEGKLEAAEQRFRQVLAAHRETLGERHPETLMQQANLCVVLTERGQFEEANTLGRETLESFREVYGAGHPLTARQQSNLGVGLFRAGSYREAEPLLSEALGVLRERYGDSNPQTLITRGCLAGVRLEIEPSAENLEECREVFEAQRSALGLEHANTIESLNRLACAHLALRQLDRAEPLFRELIDVCREVHAGDHPVTAVALENLGNVMYGSGRMDESVELVSEVLEMRTRLLGPMHPDVARTTYNLGMVLQAKGDTQGALEHMEEALDKLGDSGDHSQSLRGAVLCELGDLRSKIGEHEAALARYGAALELDRSGERDEVLAGYLLHQIAVSHFALEHFEQALDSYREALKVREDALGPEDFGTRITLYGVGRALVALGRFAEAEPIALDFEQRTSRNVAPDHDHVRRARALLVEVYTGLGRSADADQWR
ncbi:MAG: serine/threonine protein kinase [Planctomycetes bacterium]|nr:serine/threonine protein kinase [Planctomycetota bacterium]